MKLIPKVASDEELHSKFEEKEVEVEDREEKWGRKGAESESEVPLSADFGNLRDTLSMKKVYSRKKKGSDYSDVILVASSFGAGLIVGIAGAWLMFQRYSNSKEK